MYRLGLRLTLHSGREPLVRLLVTAAAVAVGVAIMLAVLGFNLLGDGLRDILDPQLRGR